MAPLAAFVGRFLAALAFLLFVVSHEPFLSVLRLPYCRFLASVCAHALQAVGIPATLHGASLLYAENGFTLIPGCDGVALLCCLLAAAAALPLWSPARRCYRTMRLVIAALAALVVLGWLRVLILAATAVLKPGSYATIHNEVLNAGIALATVWVSVLCVRRALQWPGNSGSPS